MPDPVLPPDLTAALDAVPADERAALARLWALATPPEAPAPDSSRREATWARIEAQRHAMERAPLPPRPVRVRPAPERAPVSRGRTLARRAALVLPALVLTVVLGWWWQRPVTLVGRPGAPQTLADGSTVTLAPGARLSYERGAPRSVRLSGEATFDVAHDAAHPFSVTTANARVEVLGTVFTVFAASDQTTRVHVARGRVAVEARADAGAAAQRVVLAAGQRTEVEGTTVAPASANALLAVGPIHVDGVPLGTLVEQLGERYGVAIRLPDTLRARPWTLHLTGAPLLEDALNAVTLPNGLGWRRTESGEVVVFER